MPEKFELSLEKIMMKGKYNSKNTINRMLHDLQRVGLCTIYKGTKGNQRIGMYDCNLYTLLPIYTAKWSNLNKGESKRPVLTKKNLQSTPPKRVISYNSTELKFQRMLKAGLQDILVDAGILTRSYKSFGSKPGRKITKEQYSKCLVYALNDVELRSILSTQINASQINITKGEGCYFDGRLSTYHKDRFNYFNFDLVELVDGNGNFDELFDVVLESKIDRSNCIKNKIYGKGKLSV